MDESPRQPVRLYLLDDHTLFREGLLRLLGADARFDVVGQSGTLAQAIVQIASLGRTWSSSTTTWANTTPWITCGAKPSRRAVRPHWWSLRACPSVTRWR